MTRDQLGELLDMIRLRSIILTRTKGDDNYAGCLELERQRLVFRWAEVPGVVIWKAVPFVSRDPTSPGVPTP